MRSPAKPMPQCGKWRAGRGAGKRDSPYLLYALIFNHEFVIKIKDVGNEFDTENKRDKKNADLQSDHYPQAHKY